MIYDKLRVVVPVVALGIIGWLFYAAIAYAADSLTTKQVNSYAKRGGTESGSEYYQLLAGYDSTNDVFRAVAVGSDGAVGIGSAPQTLGDALSVTSSSIGADIMFGFNGSTYDRLRVDGSRNLLVSLGTALDGANDTVSIRVNNTAPAALADATANPTTIHIATDLFGYNGTTFDRLRTAASSGTGLGVLFVSEYTSDITVTNNADTSTTGVETSYTIPTGQSATCWASSFITAGGAARVMDLEISRSSTVYTIARLAAGANSGSQTMGPVMAESGDIVQLDTTTAGAGGSTEDQVIHCQLARF